MSQTREPITGQLFESGAAHVRPLPGPQKVARNRMQVDVAAGAGVLRFSWPAGANITHLTFVATLHAAAVLANDEYVIATIDAANDTEADGNIGTSGDPPESLTADAQFIVIPLNVPVSVPLTNAMVNGPSSGGRVDLRVIGSSALDVFIGAN